MSCEKFTKNELNDYIDKELSEEKMLLIKKHLLTCKECFFYINDIRKISLLLKPERTEVPHTVWNSIVQKIDKKKQNFIFRFKLIPALIALIILVSTFVTNIYNNSIINNYFNAQISYIYKENALYEWYFDNNNNDTNAIINFLESNALL